MVQVNGLINPNNGFRRRYITCGIHQMSSRPLDWNISDGAHWIYLILFLVPKDSATPSKILAVHWYPMDNFQRIVCPTQPLLTLIKVTKEHKKKHSGQLLVNQDCYSFRHAIWEPEHGVHSYLNKFARIT